MVRTTHEWLRSMSRDFVSIKATVDRLVQWSNEELQEQHKETELEVEAMLPPKRRLKKLIRPEEMSHVETVTSPEKTSKVTVHNLIMDTATEKESSPSVY